MESLALGLAGESLPPRTDERISKAHHNRWAFAILTGLLILSPSSIAACKDLAISSAILQFRANNLTRIGNLMTAEAASDWLRRAVVKQDFHEPRVSVFAMLSLVKWMAALTSAGVTSKTSVISSTDIPASRLSKTICTGMRVPLNTHAPLTLPGTLSTAGHCDQSRLAISPAYLL